MDDKTGIFSRIKLTKSATSKNNDMSTKLDSLRKDIERLKKNLSRIEYELDKMDHDPDCDHSHMTKLIRDKAEIEKLCNDIEKQILAEDRRCDTKPGDQESPSQEIYRMKTESYGIMRMNYGTLDNNL